MPFKKTSSKNLQAPIGANTTFIGRTEELHFFVEHILRPEEPAYILSELHHRQSVKDAERLEDPIGDLTKAFVKELNHLADIQVTLTANRTKRQRRVVLFLDTFEQLATEAAPWLLNHFLLADINPNVVLVIAG